MNKEFVPYEEALTLKKLHFNEPCLGWYDEGGNFYTEMQEYLPAPLYQQAFRWFREEHSLCGCADYYRDGIWSYSISECVLEGKIIVDFMSSDDSFEEAEQACLKKLIEIVKQNKDE